MDPKAPPRSTAPLSNATSKGYAFVSAWEKKVVLNSKQLSAVALLSDCGQLPQPDDGDGSVSASAQLDDSQNLPEEGRVQHFKGARHTSPALLMHRWHRTRSNRTAACLTACQG